MISVPVLYMPMHERLRHLARHTIMMMACGFVNRKQAIYFEHNVVVFKSTHILLLHQGSIKLTTRDSWIYSSNKKSKHTVLHQWS